MNNFNQRLQNKIKENGLPNTLILKFLFEDEADITFSFPLNGDDVSMDLTLQAEQDVLLYKITEEKLSILVKYFEGLTL